MGQQRAFTQRAGTQIMLAFSLQTKKNLILKEERLIPGTYVYDTRVPYDMRSSVALTDLLTLPTSSRPLPIRYLS